MKFQSTNKNEYIQYFMSFQTLYRELAENFQLDFIFVDLGPNHEKLNMAFILSGHYLLPPVHADFFSAASVYRLLIKGGVLDEWNKWRKGFINECKDEGQMGRFLDQGLDRFQDMVKMLPFIVSGYETQKIKKLNQKGYGYSKTEKVEYVIDGETMEFYDEISPVEPVYALFIGTIEKLVEEPPKKEDDIVPDEVRHMMVKDSGRMVIPFMRSIKYGTIISQQLGISLPEIFETDMGAHWGNKWTNRFSRKQYKFDNELAGQRFGHHDDRLHLEQKSLAAFLKHLDGGESGAGGGGDIGGGPAGGDGMGGGGGMGGGVSVGSADSGGASSKFV